MHFSDSRRLVVSLLLLVPALFSLAGGTAAAWSDDAAAPTEDSPDSLSQAASQDSLVVAHALVVERKLGQAEPLLRRVLARREERFGESSLEVARALDLLVQCLWQGGQSQTEETARLAARVVAIKEEIFGADHPEVARSLFSVAVIHAMGGDYAGAEPVFARVLAIREAHLPPEHQDMASSINALANIRYLLSDFAGALPLYRRSLAIAETVGGPLDRQAIAIRGNVANTLIKLGAYSQARSVLDRQIDLLESEGLEIEDLGYAYSLLGNIFVALEDHGEALRVRRRSLEIREAFHPENHPRIAESLLNLGNTLCGIGQLDEGIPLIKRAQGIWEGQYGPEHPYVSSFHATLGQLAFEQGQLEEARRLLQLALTIREKSIGAETPRAAEVLQWLGCVALEEGRFEESRGYLEKAIRIVSEQIGPRHPLVAKYGYDLARLEFRSGRPEAAVERALAAANAQFDHLRLTLRALPERQALLYAGRAWLPLDLVLSAISEIDDPELTKRVWDVLIRSRAMVCDEMAARSRRSVLAADSAAFQGLESYRLASTRLANLMVRGPEDADPAIYRQLIEDARLEMESAERALAGESGLGDRGEGEIGLTEVVRALPDASAMVAFVRYQKHQAGPSGAGETRPWYRAFVLGASQAAPVTVGIGDANGFDALIADWRREAARGPAHGHQDPEERNRAYRNVGTLLRELLWDPVGDQLEGARRIFVVPDGQVHLLNLAALPAPGGQYLLELPLTFHQLSAEREIAAPPAMAAQAEDPGGMAETMQPAAGGALVLGAPDFDQLHTVSVHPPRVGGESHAGFLAAAQLFRGERPNCAELRSWRFAPLPSSDREAHEVADLWRTGLLAGGQEEPGSPIAPVLLLTGSSASETAFKQAAPGKRVLHLATHAYFLDPKCLVQSEADRAGRTNTGIEVEGSAEGTGLGSSLVRVYNPLLLSGLALAGANNRHAATPEFDDGVLTAQEIATLDLSATRWAVLSACETGIGEIQSGEGVLGLQRAFRIAGARTLITSLWSVEDEAARRWMSAFYRASAVDGFDTMESVREASLTVLRERRDLGEDTHPFFWAAFIASGDWR